VLTLLGYSKVYNAILDPGPGVLLAAPPTQFTMYDAVDWQSIPDWAAAVAGYVNGAISTWPKAAWDHFGSLGIPALRIDVIGNSPGNSDVLDIERGDVDPSDATTIGNWLSAKLAAGGPLPKLYCNTSSIAAVRVSAGGKPFKWWAAHYTGVAHQEPGADATQWTDPSTGSGGDYDLSLCTGDFLS
jgi:hypothetical protein